jgi:hypothetical protein
MQQICQCHFLFLLSPRSDDGESGGLAAAHRLDLSL